jgi:hypothetical protein
MMTGGDQRIDEVTADKAGTTKNCDLHNQSSSFVACV